MFNRATNRIINGICEYCGVPAAGCEHYRDGAQQPLDEKERLAKSETAPAMRSISVEPLKEEEKASSMAEAKAKMEENVAKEEAKVEEPAAEQPKAKKPRAKK